LFEQATLSSSLEDFYNNGLIKDVLYQVKSGKEASVYCCEASPEDPFGILEGAEFVAAKIYRPTQMAGWGNDALRSGRQGGRFRDDSMYRAGQGFRKRRERVAFEKKTRFGRDLQLGSWVNSEWENLQELHRAGADVPRPYMNSGNAILMEYVGDESSSAPVLNEVDLDRDEAHVLWRRTLRNIEMFLGCNRVHADLSAFNILYWEGRITVIDVPQAVDARVNPNAQMLLQRDLANVYRYFSRQGVEADTDRIARDLWARFRRGLL
jgi:RIO kinase 1